MKAVATMDADGRITLPAEARAELGLAGATAFEVETTADGILLRPTDEDAWAYTPRHRALLERAMADVRAGRVRQLSEHDLEVLG